MKRQPIHSKPDNCWFPPLHVFGQSTRNPFLPNQIPCTLQNPISVRSWKMKLYPITQVGRHRAGNSSELSEARIYTLLIPHVLLPHLSFLLVPLLRKHKCHLGERGPGCGEAAVSLFLVSLTFWVLETSRTGPQPPVGPALLFYDFILSALLKY